VLSIDNIEEQIIESYVEIPYTKNTVDNYSLNSNEKIIAPEYKRRGERISFQNIEIATNILFFIEQKALIPLARVILVTTKGNFIWKLENDTVEEYEERIEFLGQNTPCILSNSIDFIELRRTHRGEPLPAPMTPYQFLQNETQIPSDYYLINEYFKNGYFIRHFLLPNTITSIVGLYKGNTFNYYQVIGHFDVLEEGIKGKQVRAFTPWIEPEYEEMLADKVSIINGLPVSVIGTNESKIVKLYDNEYQY
jgi:uncharacterized protein (UPF0248 family)